MARCFAVVISQAPGLSGTPDSGHFSRAATRASCASSSARPTSRTIRARPAMSRADSIFQTASIARCVSVAVTATHHTIFNTSAQAGTLHAMNCASTRPLCATALRFGSKVLRPEHLANLGLPLPARPIFLVKFHEAHRGRDRLFLRFQLKLRVSTDNLLGLCERPVDHGKLPTGKPDSGSQRRWAESTAPEHRAGIARFFAELPNRFH